MLMCGLMVSGIEMERAIDAIGFLSLASRYLHVDRLHTLGTQRLRKGIHTRRYLACRICTHTL